MLGARQIVDRMQWRAYQAKAGPIRSVFIDRDLTPADNHSWFNAGVQADAQAFAEALMAHLAPRQPASTVLPC